MTPFDPDEYQQHEDSLKYYRDLKNSFDTAREEGREEGITQGKKNKQLEIARGMKKDGMDINIIMKYTGLSREEIEGLND